MPCRQCQTLERRYRRAILRINAVVNHKFETRATKMDELRKWQDERDDAARAWFGHRRAHVEAAFVPDPIDNRPTLEQARDLLVQFLNGMLEQKKPPSRSVDQPRTNKARTN
jgi:hypothetical protein